MEYVVPLLEQLTNKINNDIKPQFISKEDLEWLKNDLEKNTLPSILFTHFGMAEDNMKGNWWFESCSEHALLGNRKEVKEILKKDKNLIAVFSLHYGNFCLY